MSSVIHIPKRPDIGLRQLCMLIVLLLGLIVIFLRLWYLQVVKTAELTEQAQVLGMNTVPRLAPRGLIEDRKGRLLAGVRSALVITAIPQVLNRNPQVVQRLSELIGVTPEEIQQRLDNAKWRSGMPSPIYTGVSVETATKIAESIDELPGVDVVSEPVRYYPDPESFAHVLGYVGTPSTHDVNRLAKEDLRASDYVGKSGVEYLYEKELMGKPGSDSVEVDARRRPVRMVEGESPVPGDCLVTSIDRDAQQIAMQKLKEAEQESPGSGGAVVAIDPATGEVLCLASNPSFDASLFEQGIKGGDYNQLANDPMKPLFNRAIRGGYSPGSTFKIVDTLAAAKAGTFDPNRTVYCAGGYHIGRRFLRCLGHHGAIRYREALYHSCNTYFADLAMRTGPDAIRAEALEVGLGRKSGIDQTGEGKAVVPTDEWLAATQKLPPGKKPQWYPGDTANMGIGQGELNVTPLQMCDLACMVANEGICYRPHLVRAMIDSSDVVNKVLPEPLYKTEVQPQVWADLKEAMTLVIEKGTGARARIPGLVWAGKTGSTEHAHGSSRTHSWFMGFAPLDHPRIAIAVIVEQSGHGGSVAAPIASAVIKQYLGIQDDKVVQRANRTKKRKSQPAIALSASPIQ